MKKDIQVFVVVICDQEPNNIPDAKELHQIRKSLLGVGGIVETYLAPNAPEIVAFAKWDETDIPKKVEEIKKIQGVKNVETKILIPL